MNRNIIQWGFYVYAYRYVKLTMHKCFKFCENTAGSENNTSCRGNERWGRVGVIFELGLEV